MDAHCYRLPSSAEGRVAPPSSLPATHCHTTMSKLFTTRTALALAAAVLLAACGGGESPRTASQTFADALASTPAPARSDRLRALGAGSGSTSAAAGPITNAQLFQGAEAIFPTLFPTNPPPATINDLPYQGRVFQVKAYGNGNYLGVSSDGIVWGLGPYTGGALVQFNTVQSYADLVCGTINCGGGGGTGAVGPLNGCTEGASVALVTGRSYTATYIDEVFVAPTSTGEWTITGVVNGPTTFENQSVVKTTNTIKGIQRGFAADITVLSYAQASQFDLTRTVGADTSFSVQGFNTTNRVVWTAPASLNNEFSLAVGGTLTKTETATSSTVIPGLPNIPGNGTPSTTTTTWTYEANDSVSVPAGSFTTCRYRQTSPGTPGWTTHWFITGQGIAAKTESYSATGALEYRAQLKSKSL